MKNKILTAISTIMLFVPWTILPLRTFDWALESPVAEIMVYSYAAFMIFSGIFSILSYTKGKVKSKLMQVCVVINSIYAVGAIAIIGMNIVAGDDMKKIKILTAALLSLCLVFTITGCSGDNLKDSVINGFNDMLQHFSKYALTDEKDLQGDKTKGEDTYTGSYTADYEDFNDKEYIFGGTTLERDKGSELTVTYELTVDSGTAKLYWLDKGEEKMIADTSKNGTYSVTLDEGDNYLTLEGNDFCGSLQVVVE